MPSVLTGRKIKIMGKSNAVIQNSCRGRLREVLPIGNLENFTVSGFLVFRI